jgi:hypothetical protein
MTFDGPDVPGLSIFDGARSKFPLGNFSKSYDTKIVLDTAR